jgi:hypothetical protein
MDKLIEFDGSIAMLLSKITCIKLHEGKVFVHTITSGGFFEIDLDFQVAVQLLRAALGEVKIH